jgi:hypothetical protein
MPLKLFFFPILLSFFQATVHTKQKKNCPEKPQLGYIVQCKQAPHTPILRKSGKGRHVYARARSPDHHVARG